jgi:hypothetical protein
MAWLTVIAYPTGGVDARDLRLAEALARRSDTGNVRAAEELATSARNPDAWWLQDRGEDSYALVWTGPSPVTMSTERPFYPEPGSTSNLFDPSSSVFRQYQFGLRPPIASQ